MFQSENDKLKKENESYLNTITTNNIRMNNYQATIDDLNKEMNNVKTRLAEKETMIEFLKKVMNTEMFTNILDKWITSINQKNYTGAYEAQNLRDAFDTKQIIGFEKFKSMFANIERIDLKSVEINFNDVKRLQNNEVAFIMITDVTKKVNDTGESGQETFYMYEGANRAVVIFKFNDNNQSWYIYQINFYRYNMAEPQ